MKTSLFLTALCASALSACATFPQTTYQEGVRVTESEATFDGNSATDARRAYMYAMVAAVETCFDRGMLAFTSDPEDQSTSNTSIYTTTQTQSVPRYFTYQGKSYRSSSADTYTTTTSYPITYRYPRYSVSYFCMPRVYNLGFVGSNLPDGAVNSHTKDFLGAVLVKEVATPKSPFKVGDVIISLGSQRVTNRRDLVLKQLPELTGKSVKVRIIRDNKMKTLKIPLNNQAEEWLAAKNIPTIAAACNEHGKSDRTLAICQRPESEWRALFNKVGVSNPAMQDVFLGFVMPKEEASTNDAEQSTEQM